MTALKKVASLLFIAVTVFIILAVFDVLIGMPPRSSYTGSLALVVAFEAWWKAHD